MKSTFEGLSQQQNIQMFGSPAAVGQAAAPAGAAKLAGGPIRLEVSNVYKVFDKDPKPALKMLADGADKDEVFKKLGAVVGVQDASFQVRAGEIFVIMGLSGSGKSTMIRLLNRLIDPSSGSIVLDGRDLTKMSNRELIEVRRRDMGMVFQSFALLPHLTALDNAAFGLEVSGVAKTTRRDAAMKALEAVGLGAYAHRYPREMSGGMQQRVGLARALANDPTILLMDEAFSALDPLIRTEMQDELLRLQREHSRTIVFISHDLDEAMRIGDRIAIMQGGRVVQVGTPYEILRDPADDYVRSFFRNVDTSKVLRAGDVARYEAANTVVRVPGELLPALAQLDEGGHEYGYVRDGGHAYQGIVSRASLRRALDMPQPRFVHAFLSGVDPVRSDTPLNRILDIVADAECPVPVVDEQGTYLGAISRSILLRTLQRGD
ncbi:glycine betaine/L-proline ABC transporter ATP-binding protein ProV [Azospirillum sp. SYSU D00513]|uniref:glycine betaine/L-proline ABC transporter ATP-binding protein ProV n=1 Tax=Azospirillum sp. SYSU D00513 TaxID=2812561 RepID=UPI001FFEC7B9|nr:glycine betaine/L-proline ABC transporter ATP-binding protein ProV [Azospirillum sp. SYSU D00513]